ncbi:unnamed protein product [Echinostoma caproni]|uniref:DUF1016_N domain-containing protein n=1 Tax=Echinostoma caproni TaxID=27848 RepID=A0A183AIZ9_9TREM|nr:unnamed protein product [Echinostoma caproni]
MLLQASTDDCLLTQPFAVSQSDLVRETEKYYHSISFCVGQGWRSDIKRRFREFYKLREQNFCSVLCYNDRITYAILNDLDFGHLVSEKLKSLARLTCCWPGLNRVAKSCADCVPRTHRQPSKWTPRPVSSEFWKRMCGLLWSTIRQVLRIGDHRFL